MAVRLSDLPDLEDLAMFVAIVECGGVNAASRRLTIPKSRLSRHLAALEARYNVELLRRSTRGFAVTDVGRDVYEQCQILLDQMQSARAIMTQAQGQPHGVLRVSCPAPLANFWLAPILPKFLQAHPSLQIELESRDRNVDMVADRIDLAIQIRPTPLPDSDLLIRRLGTSQHILVAAPDLLAQFPAPVHPSDFLAMPLIGFGGQQGMSEWRLKHRRGDSHAMRFRPRLTSDELVVLLAAAVEGVGAALLPAHFCQAAIASGGLQMPLPDWRGPLNNIHAAYLSRRALPAGARALIDFLAKELPKGDISS